MFAESSSVAFGRMNLIWLCTHIGIPALSSSAETQKLAKRFLALIQRHEALSRCLFSWKIGPWTKQETPNKEANTLLEP